MAFASSATEVWQMLVDATAGYSTLHLIQGSFGERWFHLQRALSPQAQSLWLSLDMPWESYRSALSAFPQAEYVAVVHVETSIGALLSHFRDIRSAFPESIIAVDATSSIGGLSLPWDLVDIAFASVQKCLGLPPGLAVLAVSSRILDRFSFSSRRRFNDLAYVLECARRHEPPHTPALLNIFLLSRVFADREPPTEELLWQRARWIEEEMQKRGFMSLLPPSWRSPTVLTFQWQSSAQGSLLRSKAQEKGLYLGWGYGSYRDTTFRIANFPAIPDSAYELLLEVLSERGFQ